MSHPLQLVNAEPIETATQAVPMLPLGREGWLGFARAIDSEKSKACGGWRKAGWSYLRQGGPFYTLPRATERAGGVLGPANWQSRGEVTSRGRPLKPKGERWGQR